MTPCWTSRLIERGLKKPGKTKGGLAAAMGVRAGAVSEILSGIRLIKASEIAPIIGYLELNSVPIMGRVGAGASIEPEHEQVPPEGLGEVELPFPIAEETIAFEVAGDSMLPKYENGDIIVVFREQRHPLSSFYGEEAAVRLKTGERYLKTIERGKSPTLVNLTSFNAKPINGVKLEWIGEICVTLPRGQIERLRSKAAARSAQGGQGLKADVRRRNSRRACDWRRMWRFSPAANHETRTTVVKFLIFRIFA